ncbi:MAG: site-specific integrase [Bdellovibrionales bacterium]|nr:site-specific integrase [Bdellovibrionales bacterium]
MFITSRKRKDGKIVYDVNYRLGGRGSKQFSRTFDRKIDARNFLIEKNEEKRQQQLGLVNTSSFEETTFELEALRWLEYGRVKFSSSHFKRVSGILENDIFSDYGKFSPNKFTPEAIHNIQLRMKSENKRLKGQLRKNASVNRIIEVIVAVLNYAVKQKRIPFNPAKGYSKLPNDAQEMLYWEPYEVKNFLAFLDNEFPSKHKDRWVFSAIFTALTTGLRANELWALDPQAVTNTKNTMLIKRQWDPETKSFTLLKGKRNKANRNELPYRHVPKPENLDSELKRLILSRGIKNGEPVFGTDEGQVRNHDGFVDRYDRLIKKWGGRRIRFHDLRHTAITMWAHERCKPKVIQAMAGHEDLKTTMKYIHLVGGSVEEFASQLDIFSEEDRVISVNFG